MEVEELEEPQAQQQQQQQQEQQEQAEAGATKVAMPYLDVFFEDGADRGLLTQVAEEDTCDPRFWCFQDVHHGQRPAGKVLFADGTTMFVTVWPGAELEGTLVDEDGDRHSYKQAAAPDVAKTQQEVPKQSACERPAEAEVARARRSRRRVAADAGSEVEGESGTEDWLPETSARAALREEGDKDDEDWVEKRSPPPKGKRRRKNAAARPPSGVRGGSKGDADRKANEPLQALTGTAGDTEVSSAVGPAPLGQEEPRVEELPPAATAELPPLPPPRSPPGSRVPLATPPASACASKEEAAAQQSSSESSPDIEMAGQNWESHVEEASREPLDLTLPEQEEPEPLSNLGPSPAGPDEKLPEASSGMALERAKTGRSSCRACGESIGQSALRCGMSAYSGGRTTMFWSHPRCFLEKVTVDYAPARRGKCKSTGAAFCKGDLRVAFELCGHRTVWSPMEAARWTAPASAVLAKEDIAREVLPGAAAVEALDMEQRPILLNLLQRGTLPPPNMKMRKPLASSKKRRRPDPPKAVSDLASAACKLASATPPVPPQGLPLRARIPLDLDEMDEADSEMELDCSPGAAALREAPSSRAARILDEDSDGGGAHSDGDSELELVL